MRRLVMRKCHNGQDKGIIRNEWVDWTLIKEIMNKYDLEVIQYKQIMNDSYGDFVGEDWKIAVAQLILSIENRKVYKQGKQ